MPFFVKGFLRFINVTQRKRFGNQWCDLFALDTLD